MGDTSDDQYKYAKAIVDAAQNSTGPAGQGIIIELNYGGENIFGGKYQSCYVMVINGKILRLTDTQAERMKVLFDLPELDASSKKSTWANYGIDKTWD
jgi:hypothetical protein